MQSPVRLLRLLCATSLFATVAAAVANWRHVGAAHKYSADARARVLIPADEPRFVSESGRSLLKAPGVLAVSAEEKAVAVTVGSGDYEFSTTTSNAP